MVEDVIFERLQCRFLVRFFRRPWLWVRGCKLRNVGQAHVYYHQCIADTRIIDSTVHSSVQQLFYPAYKNLQELLRG